MTRSQGIAADVAGQLRAWNPLLWVVTREEARVERYDRSGSFSRVCVPYVGCCGRSL